MGKSSWPRLGRLLMQLREFEYTRKGGQLKVGVIGATGFLGRIAVMALRRRGHQVAALVRSKDKAMRLLGVEAETRVVGDYGRDLVGALGGLDAVVNLAGSPLIGRRWTSRRLREAEASRIGLTQALASAISASSERPKVLVSASAVGYYGDRGNEELTEDASSGSGYLAELCRKWEAAASDVSKLGVRVCCMRLGVVLQRFAGILEPFDAARVLGLGIGLPAPRAWLAWVHADDFAEALNWLLQQEAAEGPFNLCSPAPVRYQDFTAALADVSGSPKLKMSIPLRMAKIALGEGATALTGSQRALPSRLLESGFRFRYPESSGALADLYDESWLSVERPVSYSEAERVLSSQSERPPEIGIPGPTKGALLHSHVVLASESSAVRAFHADPRNLGVLVPARLPFRVAGATYDETENRWNVVYYTGMGPVGLRYRGVVFGSGNEAEFFDASDARAPLVWLHRHRIQPAPLPAADGDDQGKTVVADDLWFSGPIQGALGRLHDWIARYMFVHRHFALGWRFGRIVPSSA